MSTFKVAPNFIRPVQSSSFKMHIQEMTSSLSGLLSRIVVVTYGDRDSEMALSAMDSPNEITHIILQETCFL